jgi:hypothetical protein
MNNKVATHQAPHQYPVELTQQGVNKFTVVYGRHVRAGLDYNRAAREYGECVMHAAACAGLLQDEK